MWTSLPASERIKSASKNTNVDAAAGPEAGVAVGGAQGVYSQKPVWVEHGNMAMHHEH